jgi:hypothetical protein
MKKIWMSLRQNQLTRNRMPKVMLNCRPNGRRRLGRPLKRLLDEAETGLLRPNSWWMMIALNFALNSIICLWNKWTSRKIRRHIKSHRTVFQNLSTGHASGNCSRPIFTSRLIFTVCVCSYF